MTIVQGSKDSYTDKQKRKAGHIEQGYEERVLEQGEAEHRAWATVDKQDGGGKESGSGRAIDRSQAAKKGSAASG